MDQALVTWARAVKRRAKSGLPPLWLFSDPARMPDLLSAVAALPRGLCGVLFRHDSEPDRAELGRKIARICRARHLALVVAGDARLAAELGAGLHLRGGRRSGFLRLPAKRLITASVHNAAEARRGRRAGAAILFCSPVFATLSHPGGAVLGVRGWRRLARLAPPGRAYALGGINGKTVHSFGKSCAGAAGIDVFLTKTDKLTEPDRSKPKANPKQPQSKPKANLKQEQDQPGKNR